MRTTLNLIDSMFHEAARVTGVRKKTELIHLGLQSLIREAARQRLTRLKGAIKRARAPFRRKMS